MVSARHPSPTPGLKLRPRIESCFPHRSLLLTGTQTCPGGSYQKVAGSPQSALPSGRRNALYFGDEKRYPGSTRQAGRQGQAPRGNLPELPGPHLQSSHPVPLGTAHVAHDVVPDHDGLWGRRRKALRSGVGTAFFLHPLIVSDIANLLI